MAFTGFLTLIHPEGVYDDPKGQPLRRELYPRLNFHFQFRNELSLFAETNDHGRMTFSINIYGFAKDTIDFLSVNNLFQPSTIDGCFLHNGLGACQGIKIKDSSKMSYVWNIKPHISRLVHFTKKELDVIARTFEGSDDWQAAKLVSVHAQEIMQVLEKLGQFSTSLKDFETKITVCWDETNDLNAGFIQRRTQFPDIEGYEMIYSGPHFFVANPLYKTPREICNQNSHYEIIDFKIIEKTFIPRTNYIPSNINNYFPLISKGLVVGRNKVGDTVHDNWLDYYKLGFRKMLNQAGERTLIGAILPPKSAHVNGVISTIFRNKDNLLELAGTSSSIVFDFFIKTIGKSNLYDETISSFPLGIDKEYKLQLFARTLLLNCLNQYYASLWERNWQEKFKQDIWSKSDPRLKPFHTLTKEWQWEPPLRNWYERRQALVEIDVITAMALGLSLDELILIYNVQFPVLQQNEDDTWYDRQGNIVFTCSKGLTGVGMDRSEWDHIRAIQAEETIDCSRFENMRCEQSGQIIYTITKSELYYVQEKIFYAPFDKCDRVEDYKVAWGHFEEVFNNY